MTYTVFILVLSAGLAACASERSTQGGGGGSENGAGATGSAAAGGLGGEGYVNEGGKSSCWMPEDACDCPPGCPAEAPEVGEPCDACELDSCDFDADETGCGGSFRCIEGLWQRDSACDGCVGLDATACGEEPHCHYVTTECFDVDDAFCTGAPLCEGEGDCPSGFACQDIQVLGSPAACHPHASAESTSLSICVPPVSAP